MDHSEDHSTEGNTNARASIDPQRLERVARKVRMVIPHVAGDVRAELEEIRDDLEALCGPSAEIVRLGPKR